ncbi:uncharacterized protein CCOS01_11636 [Colletotrichum costaricense]|uniref:Uncharacterized protein n=1 Tax=Colletotrichum costaricense TaxID=1209916 RepID=A0AAI9YPQ2_9PEZI|nr:uncharacterized protein CCOS01_11636 [Colletotrichum costaricense]KAK1518816.1 hypothetical protein CCOS01_11636 [Colletotrichum costaricense]
MSCLIMYGPRSTSSCKSVVFPSSSPSHRPPYDMPSSSHNIPTA